MGIKPSQIQFSQTSFVLILAFPWLCCCYRSNQLHILRVQVVSLEDVDRRCGEGEPQVHLSLPFICSTEALSLFVDHSMAAAAWQKDWRGSGGAILQDWLLLYFSSCLQRQKGCWLDWGRALTNGDLYDCRSETSEENTKYQAVGVVGLTFI